MKKKSEKKKNVSMKWYYLIPLMFIISVVPLIVHLKIVSLSGDALRYWNGQQYDYDFFSYYKMIWLLINSIFVFGVLSYKIYKDKGIKKGNLLYYIPMMVYSLFIFLSALFSKNGDIALFGYPSRYEGMFVLLSYMVVLFAAMNLVSEEKHVKALLWPLFASAAIIGVIGVFQYIGLDIFKTEFMKGLILPSQLSGKIKFTLGEHMIYGTLYHYDYVGSYMSMLLPLTFAIFVLSKNTKYKITFGILTLLMAVVWIGSNSRAGILGGIVSIIVFLIMINKYLIKYWKYLVAGVLVVTVISIGLNKVSHGYFGERIISLVKDTKTAAQGTGTSKDPIDNVPLKDIKIYGKIATIVTQTETLNLLLGDDNSLYASDVNNKLMAMSMDSSGVGHINDSRYKDYSIRMVKTLDNKNMLQVEKSPIKLYFSMTPNGFELVDNQARPIELKPVETWGFKGKELLGSSRGYIWSRSIPLLKHTILLGYGPDTFAIHFPQYDLKGKMYAYNGDMWQLVDKPHDLYLQIGINTGIISLIAILVLFIIYAVRSIKLYFRNDYNSFTSIAGVGIFAAVCGYLTAAFFNDSVVSVAPVFWVLLGTGIAVNGMLMSVTATDK